MFNQMVEYEKNAPKAGEKALDEAFHALSDASRRKIIGLLREAGELKVGDIAQAFDMSLNGVSKHVKVLEAAGLVLRQVRGREHWLSIRWEALQSPYEFLHFYHHFWSTRIDALVDYVQNSNIQNTNKGKDNE